MTGWFSSITEHDTLDRQNWKLIRDHNLIGNSKKVTVHVTHTCWHFITVTRVACGKPPDTDMPSLLKLQQVSFRGKLARERANCYFQKMSKKSHRSWTINDFTHTLSTDSIRPPSAWRIHISDLVMEDGQLDRFPFQCTEVSSLFTFSSTDPLLKPKLNWNSERKYLCWMKWRFFTIFLLKTPLVGRPSVTVSPLFYLKIKLSNDQDYLT